MSGAQKWDEELASDLLTDVDFADDVFWHQLINQHPHIHPTNGPITPPPRLFVTEQQIVDLLRDPATHPNLLSLCLQHPRVPGPEALQAVRDREDTTAHYALWNQHLDWVSLREIYQHAHEQRPYPSHIDHAIDLLHSHNAPPDLAEAATVHIMTNAQWDTRTDTVLLVERIVSQPNLSASMVNTFMLYIMDELEHGDLRRRDDLQKLIAQIAYSGGWEFGRENEFTAGGRISADVLSLIQTRALIDRAIS